MVAQYHYENYIINELMLSKAEFEAGQVLVAHSHNLPKKLGAWRIVLKVEIGLWSQFGAAHHSIVSKIFGT
jgi:hypothetical protein